MGYDGYNYAIFILSRYNVHRYRYYIYLIR